MFSQLNTPYWEQCLVIPASSFGLPSDPSLPLFSPEELTKLEQGDAPGRSKLEKSTRLQKSEQ